MRQWFDSISKRRKVVYLLLLFTALLLAVYKLPPYRGDGQLIDRGFIRLGYHYEIAFDTFSVHAGRVEKQYRLSGVPFEDYVLELRVIPTRVAGNMLFSEFLPVFEQLKTAGVKVDVQLLANGKEYVSIDEAPLADSWVLSSWSFWNQEFADIPFSKFPNYEMHVAVSSIEPLPDPVIFQLVLLGGDRYVF